MKLITMVKSELRMISRMGLTSLLIMSYPMLVMLLLGPAFSNSFQKLGSIPVAFYSDDRATVDMIRDSAQGIGGIKLVEVGSMKEVESKVNLGNCPIGIAIIKENGQQSAVFYYDPHKAALSNYMMVTIERALVDRKGSMVNSSLSEVSNSIDDSLEIIKNKANDLKDFRAAMAGSFKDFNELGSKVDSVDSTAIGSGMDDARSAFGDTEDTMNDFSKSATNLESKALVITSMQKDLDSADLQLSSAANELQKFSDKRNSYIQKIDSADSKLRNYDSQLASMQSLVSSARSTNITSDTRYYLDSIDSRLSSARAEIGSARSDLSRARNDLMSVDVSYYSSQVSSSRQTISSMKTKLSSTQQQIYDDTNSLELKISELRKSLTKVDLWIDDLGVLSGKLDDVMSSFDSYSDDFRSDYVKWDSSVVSATDELDNLLVRFGEARIDIGDERLSPMKFRTVEVISNSNMLSVFFPAILTTDMVLASLLLPMVIGVHIRNQGMDKRIKDSNFGSFNFIVGRFIGNYLVSFVQLMIITVISMLLFHVGGIGDIFASLSVFLILPAILTAYGILISQFVHKESTAILISIALSIPSVFLSGAVIPLEMMPFPFDWVGRLSPMQVAYSVVTKAMVKGLFFFDVVLELVYLTFLIMAALFAAMLVRRFG